ncbi:MAG: hypothetical protein WAW96_11295 [Alphaproteobacteria bacterium]
MRKKAVITIIALFVCLGLADLITTFHGFSLGLIEVDYIFIPFGFTVIGITCLIVANYMVNKGIVHDSTDKIVAIWFGVLSCFSIINNLVLIA